MAQQLKRWAFTVQTTEPWLATKDLLVAKLRSHASRFTFQLERAETGQLHFQGRASFKNAQRTAEVSHKLCNAHVSREANEAGSDFYAQKEESRVAGPWTEKNTKPVKVIKRWNPEEWNPLQSYIVATLEQQCDRKILFVVDTEGCKGKTTLAMHYATTGKGIRVPTTLTSAEDFLQYVHGMTEDYQDVTIFMDIPRSVESKDQWRRWCTVLEELKNGFVYDKRYKAQQRFLGHVRLCVFTNQAPPGDLLTADRYTVHIAGNEAAGAAPAAATATAAAEEPLNPWDQAMLELDQLVLTDEEAEALLGAAL